MERQELFRETGSVLPDQPVCQGDDPATGPVVGTHPNHPCSGIIVLELQHDLRPGTTEPVDRLVVIPYYGQVPVLSGDQVHQVSLKEVGVLVLIHLDIPVSVPDPGKAVPVLFQQLVGPDQHIVKVDQAFLLLVLFVVPEQGLKQLLVAAALGLVLCQGEGIILHNGDIRQEQLNEVLLIIDALFLPQPIVEKRPGIGKDIVIGNSRKLP